MSDEPKIGDLVTLWAVQVGRRFRGFQPAAGARVVSTTAKRTPGGYKILDGYRAPDPFNSRLLVKVDRYALTADEAIARHLARCRQAAARAAVDLEDAQTALAAAEALTRP